MIEIKRYDPKDKKRWDEFCKLSLNGIFLFYRDYMDYHSDRFVDHSLMFYNGNKPVALLPCNEKIVKTDDNSVGVKILSSHDGLTFGSFIMGVHTHQSDTLDCTVALIDYCRKENISEVQFKPVPLPLQRVPSEQDVYALIKNGATLLKTEPSILTSVNDYSLNNCEKYSVRYALRYGLTFRICDEDEYWRQFYIMLTDVLHKYHDAIPVHSLSELLLLKHRFPENMRLFCVFEGNEMLAGTLVYEYNYAVHTQYMAANEEGRTKRALHFCVNRLIINYKEKKWIDFGTSMLNRGNELDIGLVSFKEGFKGNSLLYNKWSLKINKDEK